MNRSPWTQARRAARMNPSIIREILKVTEKPGILSMAGGLPSADTFPVDAIKAACDRVLSQNSRKPCSTPPARASRRCASGWPPRSRRWASIARPTRC